MHNVLFPRYTCLYPSRTCVLYVHLILQCLYFSDAKNSQGQQQPPAPKQHQNPAFTPISSNKIIGSGRIISAINKLPSEDQQQQQQKQQIKPLPMFDTRNNNNQQQKQQQQQSSQRGNNFYPNPSGWNPLNSNSFGLNVDQKQAPRLPVFSTLSK